jgi:endonuclease YncB( thermonuclease family)
VVDRRESERLHSQAFGSRAKQELSGLVFGKTVRVDGENMDRYGRTVGRVFVGDIPGFAWWYRSYAKKAVDLASAETDAKNARRGLWADKTPVPPWEFRRNVISTPLASRQR